MVRKLLLGESRMYQNINYQKAYRSQDVMSASPLRLVIMAYDLAIQSCEKKDFARATQAVSALRDALDFDYAENALGLFRLYQWILECLRKENFEEALVPLRELRDAWATVEKRLSPASQTIQNPVSNQGSRVIAAG
jgi:flagellin-specific chaperone FliS